MWFPDYTKNDDLTRHYAHYPEKNNPKDHPPKIKPKRPKARTVSFVTTEDRIAKWRAAAELQGISLGRYVRNVMEAHECVNITDTV